MEHKFVGASVISCGILLKVHETALLHDALIKEIKTAATSSGLTGTDLSTLDLWGIIEKASIGFISFGVAVCLIAVFGVHGIKSKNETLLIAYASVLGILVVTEMVFLIVVFKLRSKVDESLKTPLRDLINKQYAGFNGSDVVSVTFNYIMIQLSCCGVDGFGDFYRARKWSKSIRIDENTSIPLFTPVACCKAEERKSNNYACASNPTNRNSNYRQGCYDSFWEEVYKHNPLIVSCATGVVIFELLLIFFACWVAHKIIVIRKKKLSRQLQYSADITEDFPGDSNRGSSVSLVSSGRTSTTGTGISIRRESDGSLHIIPDATKRSSDNITSSIDPPPYTSTHTHPQLTPACIGYPILQPFLAASAITPYNTFGTFGVQNNGFNRCASCMSFGHPYCICQRRRSGSCCNPEQNGLSHMGDPRRHSCGCASEHNISIGHEQSGIPEKFSSDHLPPPYTSSHSVTSVESNPDPTLYTRSQSITSVVSNLEPTPYTRNHSVTSVASNPEPTPYTRNHSVTSVTSNPEPTPYTRNHSVTSVTSNPEPTPYTRNHSVTSVTSNPEPTPYTRNHSVTSVTSNPEPTPYTRSHSITSVTSKVDPSSIVKTDAVTTRNQFRSKSCIVRRNSSDLQTQVNALPEYSNGCRRNSADINETPAIEQSKKTNQKLPTDRTGDHDKSTEALPSPQTCASEREEDELTSLPSGMQRKRSLFNRRSISGPCTRIKDVQPKRVFMRNQSFEEEYYS
ncbi:uncharacterized protein [Argopecten irradians]|uniref:uncharacterized protein n=1 Tax=Argopecten irradians TaxID=31199 RepID=UPI003715F311